MYSITYVWLSVIVHTACMLSLDYVCLYDSYGAVSCMKLWRTFCKLEHLAKDVWRHIGKENQNKTCLYTLETRLCSQADT